ncbi:MFS transporter [Achromobacter sp. F4_2707]|uniref:MFS transporter n=1 Tax=Achromobacter sp. F4_2707 TaxID=3114286 RepID=UPI0039C6079E
MTSRRRRWLALAPDISPLRESAAFRSLYIARTVSLLSISILAVVVAWQVYGLSESSLHVAGVSVGLAIGSLIGLIWGGTLADSSDRRRIMIWGRAAYVLVVCLLWANSLRPEPGLTLIYAATLLSGFTSGISAPALMAALPRMVPGKYLAAAGALNALAMELGRLVGPLIAGALLARSSVAACYGVVFVGAVLVPVFLARIPRDCLLPEDADASQDAVGAPTPMPLFRQWVEGLRYVGQNRVVGGLLALDLVAMLFVSIYALMPELGEVVLNGGPEMVGYLYAAPAVGALLVAVSSGWTRTLARPGRVVICCTFMWGLAVMLAGISSSAAEGGYSWAPWLVLVFLAITGMADTASDIVRGALLQIHTRDSLRGRVSALWLLQGYLGPAIGGMQAAGVATLWSPSRALIIGGGLCAGLVGLGAVPGRKRVWRLGAA